MKKSVGVFLVIALAGCGTTQSDHSQRNYKPLPASAPASERIAQIKQKCESENHFEGDKQEVNMWLCEYTNAVLSQFYDVNSYAGKYCNVRIKQPEGQMPVSIKSEGGDPELCSAVIDVIKETIKAGIFPKMPKVLGGEVASRFEPN